MVNPAGIKYRSRMLKDTHRFFREEFRETRAARLRACVKRIRAPKGFLYDLISLLSRPRPFIPVYFDSSTRVTPGDCRILALCCTCHEVVLRLYCSLSRYDRSSRQSLINEKRFIYKMRKVFLFYQKGTSCLLNALSSESFEI